MTAITISKGIFDLSNDCHAGEFQNRASTKSEPQMTDSSGNPTCSVGTGC